MRMQVYLEPERDQTYVDGLFAIESEAKLKAVTSIKNAVIGNKLKKTSFIVLGIIPKLVELMLQDNCSVDLIIEAAAVIGSLARGSEGDVQGLLQSNALQVLLKGINHADRQVVEACIRALRALYLCPLTPADPVYEDPSIVPRLVNLLSGSHIEAECAAGIIAKCCQTPTHQALLCNTDAVNALMPLLVCDIPKVQLRALQCYASMSLQNSAVSLTMKAAVYEGEPLQQIFCRLLARDRLDEVQLGAAKCLTNMFRAGVFPVTEQSLPIKILSTCVRMCRKDKPCLVRAEAAETLAYLIEENTDLQRTAAISDHLIKTLSDFLVRNELSEEQFALMREGAFKALASLGANVEYIRKRIIESESTMDHVVSGLEDKKSLVRLAAVRCLHSLSRSVQQLRTSFQDTAVWKPLMKLIQEANDDMMTVGSSALCNLLLEFSPSKEPILDSGAVSLLTDLTKRESDALRLNGVWALMNMAYQADEETKNQILEVLGPSQLLALLEDRDTQVVMKTLGLMRNLLSGKDDIDRIMGIHGTKIMNSLRPILENEVQAIEVKEQALCVLANIANGSSAKEFLMSDDELLKKLMEYMMHDSVKLQMSSTYTISNLVWHTEDGAVERQTKLRDMGVQKLLQSLLTTSDTDVNLFERVKTALQQFS